jgi:hypothetical protein
VGIHDLASAKASGVLEMESRTSFLPATETLVPIVRGQGEGKVAGGGVEIPESSAKAVGQFGRTS